MIRRRHSLSTKLSLSILLIATPVFVMALGVLFLQSRYFIRQEAMEHAGSVLNTKMQRLRNYMSTVENATNASAWLAEEYFVPDSLLSISHRVVQLNSHVNGCSITAEPDMFPQTGRYFSAYTIREGDTIITAREAEYDYYDKVWYKKPRLLEKACWVDPFDDYNEGTLYTSEIIASYCKPLYQDGDNIVGVISTDLSFRQLAQAIGGDDHPYPNAYFILIGDDGRYFIHPDSAYLFKKTFFSDKDLRRDANVIALGHEMTAGKQGNMQVTLNGQLCHVCYKPVPGTSWSLALICPDSDILKRYHQLTYIIIALIVVGLLVIMIMCYKVVGRTIRPLSSLLDMTQRLADGHYDEPIPYTKRGDAIGQLQNSFATMQRSLKDHVGSIHQAVEQTKERNEELVRTTQLAEEAVRQKTAFIQDVSHQIRTPLNIILGFAQVLREDLAALGDDTKHQMAISKDEVANIAGMMKHNSAHLNRMLLMLYDSSDTGISEEKKLRRDEPVSPNKVARECIEHTLSHFPGLSIRFETDLDDSFRIHSNHLYLMRTLRELLYNSAKYSDKQHIALFVNKTSTTVRFIAQDKGPGLPEEAHDLVFNPFTKVDDLSEGLGLGLPLSKRHAKSLGGDLILDTSYHEGCRFILEVPR